MQSAYLLVVAAGLLAPADGAGAGESHRMHAVAAANCEQRVGAARQQEALSRVMRRLAATHDFRLEYWSGDDPQIRHGGGRLVELIAALSAQANMMVRYVPNPVCPGQWKVAVVWVLPRGAETAVAARAAPPAPGAPALSTPEGQAFLRAHGAETPGLPASAPVLPAP